MPAHKGCWLVRASSELIVGVFALGTAFCTALGGIIIVEVAAAAGGPLALSRWRTLIATALLAVLATLHGGWTTLAAPHLLPIAISSLCSVVVADPALNAGFVRIGARRTALLFCLNAPATTVLGWVLLGETINARVTVGLASVFTGTIAAMLYGYPPKAGGALPPRAGSYPHVETTITATGVSFGLLAAMGQAVGTIAIRPVMAAGADPFAVMTVRAAIGAVALWGICLVRPSGAAMRLPAWRVLAWVSAGAMVSFVIGMSLQMVALSGASAGIVATLSSTTSVAILPLLWLRTGQPPSWRAWCGAMLAVIGVFLIFV